jgi:hypothetical protein
MGRAISYDVTGISRATYLGMTKWACSLNFSLREIIFKILD